LLFRRATSCDQANLRISNLHLFQVAMTMVQVDVISGLPHLCTQRLEILPRFSFAFSAFFAVETIWRLRLFKRKERRERQEEKDWRT
jgi:hypothetical protein